MISTKMLSTAVVACALALVARAAVPPTASQVHEYEAFLLNTLTGKALVSNETVGSPWERSGRYQGDILLREEEVAAMVQQFAGGRNGLVSPQTRWPQNTVVYEFAQGHFTTAQRNYIVNGMNLLASRTCIRFRPRQWFEFDYVRITGNTDGCYAHVGYARGRGAHILNLAQNSAIGRGCLHTVVIIHELLHNIGFYHMQSTYNRDQFVRINYENIIRGMEHNFDRFGSNYVTNLGLPYEYTSCMHYGPHAFTNNGRTTMDALQAHSGQMGQMEFVSGYDLWRVDRLYGCAPWRSEHHYAPIHGDEIASPGPATPQ